MTSMERTLAALSHKEADRVPLFLLFSLYGARESDLSIKTYFNDPGNVVKAQRHMKEKYANDCYYAFHYAAIEVQAMGGEVLFSEDGPPIAGEPILKTAEDIVRFSPPNLADAKGLTNVLEVIRELKNGDTDTPIIGVVMSPASLPVMQMGFEHYLDLIFDQPDLFALLMKKNQDFCIHWANAQLAAGATAICYFDPISSTSILPQDQYRQWGARLAKDTLSHIQGPTATHMASGRCLPIIDDIIATGTQVVGVSTNDCLDELKEICRNRVTLLGNLDGIGMCNWSPERAYYEARQAILSAASGGGFILSDNHGEIPMQVEEEVLLSLSLAAKEVGRYPICTELNLKGRSQ